MTVAYLKVLDGAAAVLLGHSVSIKTRYDAAVHTSLHIEDAPICSREGEGKGEHSYGEA